MSTKEDVTLIKNAVHQKDEPRHFMRIKKTGKLTIASHGDVELANSKNALKIQEAGMDMYDPVFYFPRDEVNTRLLQKNDHTTHCPLKGDTEYYDIHLGEKKLENAAFSYVKPLDGAEELKDKIAFDQNVVQLIEYAPASSH